MITPTVQRWQSGRATYRPAGEVINPILYEVAEVDRETARAFVTAHHYSGSFPAARVSYGLYRGEHLQGVAVLSHPVSDKVITAALKVPAVEGVELGRFVLLDEVPGNGETWFLARVFAALRRRGLAGVVSHADPVARTAADGRVIFPGHVGTIYQAKGAAYLGRATARTLRLFADGTVLSDRTLQKIRKQEKGWRAAVELLIGYGADRPTGDVREWCRHWVAQLTRPLRHPGNLRYAWSFSRAIQLRSEPYLKLADFGGRGAA